MTPKEQFEAVIYGEFVNGSRYRYPTTIRGEEGYATMLKEQGAFWQNHQLNSFTSPNLMYDIGQNHWLSCRNRILRCLQPRS